jgi:hypothetical protein
MKFTFKLSLPLGKDGRVSAQTECAASATGWKTSLTEMSFQAGEVAAREFPRDTLAHPGGLDNALIDDFISKL